MCAVRWPVTIRSFCSLPIGLESRRMEQHHGKKRSVLPKLRASDYVHTDR